ncbi:MAG: hypothetical protein LBM13_06410 [Candidatus Ancillula sp.]|jgi:hypothetical protein|nr:hypothetical protein [Candidatus Ancillula sp.]
MKFNLKKIVFLIILVCFPFIAANEVKAFNPIAFDEQAKSRYGDKQPADVEVDQIKLKLNEVQEKILRGEIPIDSSNSDEEMLLIFLRSVSSQANWKEQYPRMARRVYSFLLKYYFYFNPTAKRVLDELPEIFSRTKDSVWKLVNSDPKFSRKFKEALRSRLDELEVFIPGITETTPLTNLQITGDQLTGLEDFEKQISLEDFEKQISIVDTEKYLESHASAPLASGHLGTYTPNPLKQVIVYPGCLINKLAFGNYYEEQVAKLTFTLGHELGHVLANFFPEIYITHNWGLYGLFAYIAPLPPKECSPGHASCNWLKIADFVATPNLSRKASSVQRELAAANPGADDQVTPDLMFRLKGVLTPEDWKKWQTQALLESGRPCDAKDGVYLPIPEAGDKEHFHEIFNFVVNAFEGDNKIIASALGISPDLISGEIAFNEIFADSVGMKVALRHAANQDKHVEEDTVWELYANQAWRPQDVKLLEQGYHNAQHSTSPFRVNGCYQVVSLSLRDKLM